MAVRSKRKSTATALFTQEDCEQLSLFAEIPSQVQKAGGPVITSLMLRRLQNEVFEVDDTHNGSEKEPLPITTRIMLDYENLQCDIEGCEKLTYYDREVIDAVASLMGYNNLITSSMIYRVMMGKKEYYHVSEQQLQKVAESMEKCRRIRLKISIQDLLEEDSPIGRKLREQGVEGRYTDDLISFSTFDLKTPKGNTKSCYIIKAQPVLFHYAKTVGKVSSFPINLADTNVAKTERNITLQSFLLHSIDDMYRGDVESRLIPIDRLYKAIAAEEDPRPHKVRYRATAKQILDDWVQKNFIVGYEERKAGRVIKGYEITLLPTKRNV